jgi:AcrR family transcriptional regulator
MAKNDAQQLSRDAWLKAALNMCEKGIDNIKIAPLAVTMGVTTGSFYWHFKNRRQLLDALLEYWECEMTDVAIAAAKRYPGTPPEIILYLMETVMNGKIARYDLPIWQWSQSDAKARRTFKRVLKKRFSFAAKMFSDAGFSRRQAEIRGRMMVIYMMGESTLIPDDMVKRKEYLKLKHAILIAPE